MSNVFRQIKSTDVYQRPFQAYKHYRLNHPGLIESYVTHSAVYYGGRIDQNGIIPYPTNSDGTNAHVAWYAINQKFYDDHSTAIPEHILNPFSQRSLFESASSLTIPYNDVGERIRKESFFLTSSIGSITTIAKEDGNGNLIDMAIPSSSFATGSFLYLSFNKMFTKFRDLVALSAFPTGLNPGSPGLTHGNAYTGSVSYELRGSTKEAQIPSGSIFTAGVQLDSGSLQHLNSNDLYAGFGLSLNKNQCIRIPHDQKFDSFGKCDDWTISFWTEIGTKGAHSFDITNSKTITRNLISKFNVKDFQALNSRKGAIFNSNQVFPSVARSITSSAIFNKLTTPFNLSVREDTDNEINEFFFHSSNGSKTMMISGSVPADIYPHHILIRNSASICEMFIDGVKSSDSGSIPDGIVANEADVIIGDFPVHSSVTYDAQTKFAELRMYDYAVSSAQIESLQNNDYLTGSLFQTHIIGNVFHRNGTAVISSPMPKYNSGSGIFSSDYTWNAKWRGTHTIYENEVFVRVPQDILNVTMNPTSTYKPITGEDGKPCTTNQVNALPGEFRKDLFISGTLKPYVTTIGLYNKNYELLAVGKLAQPIQKRDDVDMNFVVRWDY